MLFTQAVNDFKNEYGALLNAEAAERYFGSLHDSMLTLFMSLAGGVSWEQALPPLREVSAIWVICYVGYIAFTYFAVLNERASVSANSHGCTNSFSGGTCTARFWQLCALHLHMQAAI